MSAACSKSVDEDSDCLPSLPVSCPVVCVLCPSRVRATGRTFVPIDGVHLIIVLVVNDAYRVYW